MIAVRLDTERRQRGRDAGQDPLNRRHSRYGVHWANGGPISQRTKVHPLIESSPDAGLILFCQSLALTLFLRREEPGTVMASRSSRMMAARSGLHISAVARALREALRRNSRSRARS